MRKSAIRFTFDKIKIIPSKINSLRTHLSHEKAMNEKFRKKQQHVQFRIKN